MSILIIILYCILAFFIGYSIFKYLYPDARILFSLTGAFFIGNGIFVPLTYLLTIVFSYYVKEPIWWGMIGAIFLGILFIGILSKKANDSMGFG